MGPCHHGMTRPQGADGGTASSMEGSCEYIKLGVTDGRQGGGPASLALGEVLITPRFKYWLSFETDTCTLGLN